MEEFCRSQKEALAELEKTAPGAPFLALGQTVFWDEPMKAGVLQSSRRLGFDRRFVAGIHDTDYFAKYPHRELKSGYAALPHNDTDTQALWSAAGEFSALFGSETVVTRDRLAAAGGKVSHVAHMRPGYLDEITEAWGWRGIVSYGRRARTTSETPTSRLLDTLSATLDWAVRESVECVAGEKKEASIAAADKFIAMVCDATEGHEGGSLAEFYRRLLPKMYESAAGEPVEIEATRTTELLKFNRQTCHLPRFGLLQLFLAGETRELAREAYNGAVDGSQIYTLDRFGAGALPFDVVVPGKGRGTLRLGTRGGLVMTEDPLAFSFKEPVDSAQRLAEVLEQKFGPDVVIVGKAVALLGMLASEFVFVFHEGASGYVPVSRDFHRRLGKHAPRVNPILRVRYEPWDAISACKAWLRLPDPLRRPFGAEEISAESFSKRWRAVMDEQEQLLHELAELRRPLDLIEFLDKREGGQWSCLANEYLEMHKEMASLNRQVGQIRSKRAKVTKEYKRLKKERVRIEREMGRHWRTKMFEKEPTDADRSQREAYHSELEECLQKIAASRSQWQDLVREQETLVGAESSTASRERRKSIAFEAELKRMSLIRDAVISTDGLRRAGHRPAAWWFSIVSPTGCWLKATLKSAQYYLEPLV